MNCGFGIAATSVKINAIRVIVSLVNDFIFVPEKDLSWVELGWKDARLFISRQIGRHMLLMTHTAIKVSSYRIVSLLTPTEYVLE